MKQTDESTSAASCFGQKNLVIISLSFLSFFSLAYQLYSTFYPNINSTAHITFFSASDTSPTTSTHIFTHNIKLTNGTIITHTNQYHHNYSYSSNNHASSNIINYNNTNHIPSYPSPNLEDIIKSLSLTNPNIRVNMTPFDTSPVTISPVWMEGGSLRLFIYYTYGRNYYVEWGSGGSTQIAPLLINKKAFSIEHYIPWCNRMQTNEMVQISMTLNKLEFECVDTGEKLVQVGRPAHGADAVKIGKMYVNKVDEIIEGLYKEDEMFDGVLDVVLIDGRYRVACALKLFANGYVRNNRSIVMVHDFFWRAKEYKMIRDYFNLIDPKSGNMRIAKRHGTMAVFTPKVVTQELITQSKIELTHLIENGKYG